MPISANTTGQGTLSVAEIAIRVKRQFGDEAGSQINDADIMRWINDAQREIAINNDLLQVVGKVGLLAGVSQYGLPQGMLMLRSVRANKRKLDHLTRSEESNFLSDKEFSSGEPTHYSYWANALDLYPTPDKTVADALVIYYIRTPIAVTALADVPELPAQYHNRIVEYCIAQSHELDDNLESYQAKMRMFKDGVAGMKGMDDTEQDVYPSISTARDDTYYNYY